MIVREDVTTVKTLLTIYHLLNVLQQEKFFKSEDTSHAPLQI